MELPSALLTSRAAAALAAVGCSALALEPGLHVPAWLRRGFAIGLSVAAIATYFQFFSIPAPAYFHRWEMFHYVLGAKYADELGYERLYRCVAVADAESGHEAEVRKRAIRDLHDDESISAASALTDPDRCKLHFSSVRWNSFRNDVAAFRRIVADADTWAAMQTDHGYNPSPVWTLLGRPLASAAPVSEATLRRLAWIDPALMALGLGLFAWGFGPRVAWLACVFWSTQAPSEFTWTGGAFMRQDWLVLAIAALALARRRHFAAAGACLAWAALLRVFPVLFFAGPLAIAVRSLVRHKPLARELRAFVVGAALGACLLVLATFAAGARVTTYREFAAHVTMHARTPIVNHMSLRSIVSFDPRDRIAKLDLVSENAQRDWPAARRARLRARWPWFLGSAALCVFAWARCVAGLHTLWLTISLSFLLVIVLTDPSSYYYSMVVLTVPLALARRSVGVLVLGLAAASQLLMLNLRYIDERYVALSVLYLLFGGTLIVLFSRPTRLPPAAANQPEAPH
jgi:hypothetical protein